MTSPSSGLRTTGRVGSDRVHGARDARPRRRARRSFPGPQGSDDGAAGLPSDVGVSRACDTTSGIVRERARHRARGRGGGHNAVLGPDFQWRPAADRHGHGAAAVERHADAGPPGSRRRVGRARARGPTPPCSTGRTTRRTSTCSPRVRSSAQSSGPTTGSFRRSATARATSRRGWTATAQDAFFSRIRLFTIELLDADFDGNTLSSGVSAGRGNGRRWNSFFRVELNQDEFQVGHDLLRRFRPHVNIQASPGRASQLALARHVLRRGDRLRERARGERHDGHYGRHAAPEPASRTAERCQWPLAARRRRGTLGPAVHAPVSSACAARGRSTRARSCA